MLLHQAGRGGGIFGPPGVARAGLAAKLEELEKKYDAQFKIVFDAIRQLMSEPVRPRREIGFRVRERRARYGVPLVLGSRGRRL